MADRIFLVVETDPTRPRIAVDQPEPVDFVLGRSIEADLVLAAPAVSRRHCRLVRREGRLVLEDLGSRVGTQLNDKPIEAPAEVRSGDRIGLGAITVTLEIMPAEDRSASVPPPVISEAPTRATVLAEAPKETVAQGEAIRIGREPLCDVRIEDLTVSRRHARVRRTAEGWQLQDLGSTNGTFLNGIRLAGPQALRAGDQVGIAGHNYRFDPNLPGLRSIRAAAGTRIDVRSVGKVVKDRRTGRPLWLLKDVSFPILPGQFVGLLGSSGCGKSTLMDAVNGRRRATEGRVLFDGTDFYERFESFKVGIGYVPQQLIFHETLPLADALRYTSRLRLAGDTDPGEIEDNIGRVLDTVGLADRRDTLIRDLSGGQKKRVSIAMELLSRPRTLFLDEVTSGLDLGAEQQMMELFRSLADDGMTLVCITHFVDSLEVCDAVAYLVKGRLAYYGPPDKMRKYLGIEAIRFIYGKEDERKPAEWQKAFRESEDCAAYVDRLMPDEDDADETESASPSPPAPTDWSTFRRQFAVQVKRYAQILTIDRRNVMVLLGLAPLVAMLISLVGQSTEDTDWGRGGRQNILCFGSMLTMMFLGLFGSVREIVKELPIYRHERFVNLQILPYLLSKVVPLSVVGAIQALCLTFVVHVWGGLDAGGFVAQFLVLLLVSIAGTMMGLAISAGAPTSDWAVMLMIAVVIPQMLFAGAILKLQGASAWIGQVLVTGYWGQTALSEMLPERTQQFLPSPPEFTAATGVGLLLLHILIYGLIAAALLARKDGPGGLRRALAGAGATLFAKKPPPKRR